MFSASGMPRRGGLARTFWKKGRVMSLVRCLRAPFHVPVLHFIRMHSPQKWGSRLRRVERSQPQASLERRSIFKSVLFLGLAQATLVFSAFATCTAPKNAIEAENCLPGNPPWQWYVSGAGSPNIQGFTTDISVSAGQTIFFKISTNAPSIRIDTYRMA